MPSLEFGLSRLRLSQARTAGLARSSRMYRPHLTKPLGKPVPRPQSKTSSVREPINASAHICMQSSLDLESGRKLTLPRSPTLNLFVIMNFTCFLPGRLTLPSAQEGQLCRRGSLVLVGTLRHLLAPLGGPASYSTDHRSQIFGFPLPPSVLRA